MPSALGLCGGLFGGVLYLSGVRIIYFLSLIPLVGALGFVVSIYYKHPLRRLVEFYEGLTSEGGGSYNVRQALIGFGRGNWTGVGLGQSHQKMDFLPEAHTDFIFDIYGEEFGFIGSIFLLLIYEMY